MKIIKRHNYKLEPDELISVALSEERAKILCKALNELTEKNIQLRGYFFQIVSDDYEVK